MDRNFSFGGLALTPVADFTQIGMAGVAKYRLRFSNGVNLVPFAGLGFGPYRSRPRQGSEPDRSQRHQSLDPAVALVRVSGGADDRLSSTLMVNLHHITLSPAGPGRRHIR
jgi:hypothetical protein